MKDIILQSGPIEAYVNAFGAEIKGLSLNGIEYLYEGDVDYYGRTSPTLFPIVGRFLTDTYFDRDKAYHLTPSGFAQIRNFTLEEQTPEEATFLLCSDERTLVLYPYSFELRVHYQVTEKGLRIEYRVKNTGNRVMPFCLGCHTAYRWPLFPEEEPEDYELRFEEIEDLESFNPFNWKDPHFIYGQSKTLSHDLFENYTRGMTGIRSAWIEFGHKNRCHGIRIHREEMPYLAMWTLPEKEARFVCLEPCTSVHAGAATTLQDRLGCLTISPGEESQRAFSIELF